MAIPQTNPASPPLAGIVVVDLTRVLAGPFCTRVLAQLGARVIKVEMPQTGDDARAFGPFVNGKSLYFASVNAGKESIALDLKSPSDREMFDGLLALADVLVENYRPGTMERLGYGWDALHARHPKLVMASVSGFGQTGPLAPRAAYDLVVQAMGGIISVTGTEDGPPVRVGVSIGDLVAGLYTALGILSALMMRGRDGVGRRVDIAMLDCQVAILEAALTTHLTGGGTPRRIGSRHPSIAPFQIFQTKDAPLVICAGNDALFRRLCAALGDPAMAGRTEYASNELRMANVSALEADIEKTLSNLSAAQWLAAFEAAEVPAAPVLGIAEVARHEQVLFREMVQCVRDPVIGDLHLAGNPVKIGGLESAAPTPPPELDADRERILAMTRSKATPGS